MAREPKPAPEAAEKPAYTALTGLSYWAAGNLRLVAEGEAADDAPEDTVENWLTINPPAIRLATADEIAARKGTD